MAETREELALRGVLLDGQIVPDWFKRVSDGCSIRTWILRKILNADEAHSMCVIHDSGYFWAALKYEPDEPGWKIMRREADRILRNNRKKVAKTRLLGIFYAWSFWIGVRGGGAGALFRGGQDLPMPPKLEDLFQLERDIAPATRRSLMIIDAWRKELIRTTNGKT